MVKSKERERGYNYRGPGRVEKWSPCREKGTEREREHSLSHGGLIVSL